MILRANEKGACHWRGLARTLAESSALGNGRLQPQPNERVAVLLVEQNVPLTLEVGQRIYIIEKGVVRHHAPAAELRADDAVIHQYMGV